MFIFGFNIFFKLSLTLSICSITRVTVMPTTRCTGVTYSTTAWHRRRRKKSRGSWRGGYNIQTIDDTKPYILHDPRRVGRWRRQGCALTAVASQRRKYTMTEEQGYIRTYIRRVTTDAGVRCVRRIDLDTTACGHVRRTRLGVNTCMSLGERSATQSSSEQVRNGNQHLRHIV